MIDRDELKKIADARLEDSQVLCDAGRYDGAIYLCGYAVELALKHRICKTLKWTKFPPTKNYKDYKSFLTHDLEVLLHLSGFESEIKGTELMAEWSVVVEWKSEVRYNAIGSAKKTDVEAMLAATKMLLRTL